MRIWYQRGEQDVLNNVNTWCRFFAAAAFAWSFPPREYMTGEPPGFWRSVYSLFDLTDVVGDVQGTCLMHSVP